MKCQHFPVMEEWRQMRGDLSFQRKPICIYKFINIMVYVTHLQVEHHYLQNNIKLIVFRKKLRWCILLGASQLPLWMYCIVISQPEVSLCQSRTLILLRLQGVWGEYHPRRAMKHSALSFMFKGFLEYHQIMSHSDNHLTSSEYTALQKLYERKVKE